jgi:hypothetical protein
MSSDWYDNLNGFSDLFAASRRWNSAGSHLCSLPYSCPPYFIGFAKDRYTSKLVLDSLINSTP